MSARAGTAHDSVSVECRLTAPGTGRHKPPHGSSFYAAMRLLPAAEREAMFAIYAFCRHVDDVADGAGDRVSRIAALERSRGDIDALFRGIGNERTADLLNPVKRFRLAREDFISVIDGVQMDALSDIVAPEAATLDLYCDRVASAVGRLSVRVFGLEDGDGVMLAFHLGRALQFTNILRDLDEDGARGRLYLPRELLDDAGIAPVTTEAVLVHPSLAHVCTALAQQARAHFRSAEAVMARYPLAIVRAPTLMSRVYETLLDKLLTRGFSPPRRPVRTGRAAVLWSIVRWGVVRMPALRLRT